MRLLVGDIGGTNTRLAIFTSSGKKLHLEKQQEYPSQKHKSLDEILSLFLKEETLIDGGCLGIAGPVEEHTYCKLTNLSWEVNASKIASAHRIGHLTLLNDIEANAYGINTLTADKFLVINEGKALRGNRALIAAGTGLGEAPIFFDGQRHIPSPSEGGHCDFSPRDDIEVELFQYLRDLFPEHVSYERVVCGSGLTLLFRFLIEKGYEKSTPSSIEVLESKDAAKAITQRALEKQCPICERALDWFCSLYGAEAGNLALKAMCVNGMYVGGGIAPKIVKALETPTFFEAFTQKGRFASLLADMPIRVILDPETALKGAAYYAQQKHIGSIK